MTENRPAEPEWQEPDPDELERLTRIGTFAADDVWFEERTNTRITEAERTRRMVKAAIRLLLGNGLVAITPVPPDRTVFLDPPRKAGKP